MMTLSVIFVIGREKKKNKMIALLPSHFPHSEISTGTESWGPGVQAVSGGEVLADRAQ